MDEDDCAKTMCAGLEWHGRQMSSPAFIEYEYEGGNSFLFTAVPGRRFRATIVEIEDEPA